VTIQYQQPNINLMPDAATFQGILGVNTPIPGAALTPLPLTIEEITSPLITHVAGSSDLGFVTGGRVIAEWNVSINNTLNARTQSAAALFLNAGAGFIPLLGSIGYGYHRDIAAGAGTITSSEQFAVSPNDVMRIAAIRIAGVGALQFLAITCQVRVHFFPDI